MQQKPSIKRINKLLEQISKVLNAANIPYLVYGSYAFAHYSGSEEVQINDIDIIVRQSDFKNIQELFKQHDLPYELFVSEHTIHANHREEIGDYGKLFDISFDSYEYYFAEYNVDIHKSTKKPLSDDLNTHLIKKDGLMNIYEIGANIENNPKKEQYVSKLAKLKDVTRVITKQNVKALGLMEEYARRVGTTAYVWGGLIVDIYENKIVRDHDDVEHIVLNLYDHINNLVELFHKDGWKTEILKNGDLRATKERAKLHLGHLEIHDDIAKWFHNGNKGVIEFPTDWLNKETISSLNMKIHAVLPEFQYVLKNNPSLMNPDWRQREKDIEDIKRLEDLLSKRYKCLDGLCEHVRSIVLQNEPYRNNEKILGINSKDPFR